MPWCQGQLFTIKGTFTNAETGAPVDPTTVFVTIRRPDGQTSTYQYGVHADVIKDSTGVYHIDQLGSIPGTWRYWWHSTGTAQAADERTLIVTPAEAADAPDRPTSLQVDFSQLQRYVGRHLGISRDQGSWEPNERQDVLDIIRSGLRRFYWPPPLPAPEGKPPSTPYSWSFLRNLATLGLASGISTYNLPDDFGELIDGGFTFTTNQQSIAVVGEETIRQIQSQSPRVGAPKYAAVRIKAGVLTQYEVLFYPTPDDAFTVSFRYSLTPPDISEQQPVPLGGPQHSETIIEAILAAAEKTLQDEAEGVHEKRFLECLARSIQADRNLTKLDDPDVWPLENAASSLDINKAYLKRLIGRQLDYGPHPAVWTHKQSEEIKVALETGLRKFYNPPVLPGERYSHEWSFLLPTASLFTNDVEYMYDLPPGFVDMEGPLTLAPAAGYMYPPIELVAEHQIRIRLQASEAAGRPRIAAVRLKPLDPAGGTRHEILFWPPPDGSYQISYRYHVNPAMIPDEANLPYGGQQHAQTIIEACLAAAEQQSGGANGPHGQLFREALATSVSLDRRTGSPEKLGYNRDNSDRPMDPYYPFVSWHDCDQNTVTYNDQLY